MYFLIRKYLCNKYIAKNVVCFLKKMLYVSWLWSLYVGVQGCGFKMFRAVARGNDSPKETDVGMAENDLILIACLIWKQEKYMIEYLLHAVGPCWRRCLSCCYSWPCNLLLNCSIPPKASFSSLGQFKLGNCRLVYKWSLWVWRKNGILASTKVSTIFSSEIILSLLTR